MKNFYRIILLIFYLNAGVRCSFVPHKRPCDYIEPCIRVLIMKDAKELLVKSRGTYEVIDLESKQVVDNGRSSHFMRVSLQGDRICIENDCFVAKAGLRIKPSRYFSVMRGNQERRFRGMLNVLKTSDHDGLLIINRLGLEDYLKGVLPHEISERWPLAAINAQAVAARSYALYQMSLGKEKLFDLTADIYSQVYGGLSAEHYRTNIAVERTRGEVLYYSGAILPAYFHATCGGHTEDASQMWRYSDLPPLRGVPCPFCTLSPHYHWQKTIPLQEIADTLKDAGHGLTKLTMIEILDRNDSQRIKEIKFTDVSGKSIVLTGKAFRNLFGPNVIRSNQYRLSLIDNTAEFKGLGWGHGVGLCQWGALGMARKGYTYKEILTYYYPGAELTFKK